MGETTEQRAFAELLARALTGDEWAIGVLLDALDKERVADDRAS